AREGSARGSAHRAEPVHRHELPGADGEPAGRPAARLPGARHRRRAAGAAARGGARRRPGRARATAGAPPGPRPDEPRTASVLTAEGLTESMGRLFKYGLLATLAGLVEAVGILEAVLG